MGQIEEATSVCAITLTLETYGGTDQLRAIGLESSIRYHKGSEKKKMAEAQLS